MVKLCVYGAGAIGGVIAARVALAGVPVSLVGRGEHVAAIRRNGLRLSLNDHEQVARLAATNDPAELGPQDVVIVAVKAHQLGSIANGLSKLLHPSTAVAYAINGVPWWYFHSLAGTADGGRLPRLDPGGLLWDRIGPARTIGCVINFPGTVTGTGCVRQPSGNNRIALGEIGSPGTGRLDELAGCLRLAGFQVETHRDIRDEVWAKLAHVIVVSPISVLTQAPPSVTFMDPAIRQLATQIYGEVFATALAHGYPQAADINKLVAAQRSPNKPSMLQDLEASRPMEVDAQLMVPIELAHAAGVSVPMLDMMVGLVRERAAAAGLYSLDTWAVPA